MEDVAIVQKTNRGDQALNIKELFFKYIRFLPLYIICIALALFGAYLYLRYATEVYRSSANIVIQDDNATSGSNNPIDIALQSSPRKNIPVEIEIMQSRPVLSRVVEALNLNFNYFAKGKIKELNLYKIAPFQLEAIKIGDSSKSFSLSLSFPNPQGFYVNGQKELIPFGQVFKNEYGEFKLIKEGTESLSTECIITWNPTQTQAGLLQSGLLVVPRQTSGILSILMESTSPQLAADVINQLIKEYQTITIETKNKTSQQQLAFIDKELDSVSKELDSINNTYVAYRNANNVIETGTQSNSLLGQIDVANTQLKQQKLQLDNVLQIQDYLRTNNFSNVPSPLGVTDPTLSGLITEYNAAQSERRALLENAPEGNIVVKQKTETIEALRIKILENIKNIKTSFGNTVNSLQGTTATAASEVLTMPAKERGLLDIQRNLQSKVQIYNSLLNRREQASISLASTVADLIVLQGAGPDSIPVKPDRKGTRLLAIVIGLLIPTIIIVVTELLNDKITSRQDLERLTDATILGEVGHSYTDKALVVTSGNRKVIAEQFRILRSNLQYLLTKAPKPVIMVTSSFSGEGKSFISTNIGAVMALANKKTVILEFDIRKPKIVSGLEMGKHPGLTNFILGTAKMEALPVQVPGYDNLYVLACGPIPPNPAELLLDTRLEELFAYLHENFDAIIMDTAPVGMVSDAMTLSKYADCTLYIVRQGHTYKKQISLVDSFYQEGKLPKVSLVLNDAKVRAGGYGNYGGYGGYGYGGYGYGAGYFEEETETETGMGKWLRWFRKKPDTAKKS